MTRTNEIVIKLEDRFLYQGREVSYPSVLNRSISSRREALYQIRGFDFELWTELLTEKKNLCRAIGQIAEDYNKGQSRKRETEDRADRAFRNAESSSSSEFSDDERPKDSAERKTSVES